MGDLSGLGTRTQILILLSIIQNIKKTLISATLTLEDGKGIIEHYGK